MTVVRAKWENGRVVFNEPITWPEGRDLLVIDSPNAPASGLINDDHAETPEEIAEWLKWYDSLEPLEFTAEEERDLAEWREVLKDYSIQHSADGIEGLFP